MPLLADRGSRRRLFGALAVVALALGVWGMIQWFGGFELGAAGDVGVRAGVAQTGSSGGQLQGGEFAYPIAIILCFAVLVLGGVASWFWRALLVFALALNLAACLVTFERSFWVDALAGLLFSRDHRFGVRAVEGADDPRGRSGDHDRRPLVVRGLDAGDGRAAVPLALEL